MDSKTARDLMVPIEKYPQVSADARLYEAVLALDKAQQNPPPGRQPYRAVLVVEDDGRVVGKIGQLVLVRALEPQSQVADDLALLARAGVSDEFLAKTLEHHRLFRAGLNDLCRAAAQIPARKIMQPITQSIDEGTSLAEAMHRIVVWQTLSVLVTRQGHPVGLLRLSDLCDEITRQMKTAVSHQSRKERE